MFGDGLNAKVGKEKDGGNAVGDMADMVNDDTPWDGYGRGPTDEDCTECGTVFEYEPETCTMKACDESEECNPFMQMTILCEKCTTERKEVGA